MTLGFLSAMVGFGALNNNTTTEDGRFVIQPGSVSVDGQQLATSLEVINEQIRAMAAESAFLTNVSLASWSLYAAIVPVQLFTSVWYGAVTGTNYTTNTTIVTNYPFTTNVVTSTNLVTTTNVVTGTNTVNNWMEVSGLPVTMAEQKTSTLNGKLYTVGGFNGFAYTTNVYAFDGTNWTEVSSTPVLRRGPSVATLNSKLYLIGGKELPTPYEIKTNVYSFDGTNWTEVSGMPQGRSESGFSVFSNKIYVIGGLGYGSTKTNVYAFDGTNWTEVAGLPVSRWYLKAATLGNKLYAIGGIPTSVSGYAPTTNMYEYNGSTWMEVAGLPASRLFFEAVTFSNKIYIIGGDGTNGSDVKTNVYAFDGTNWTEGVGLPTARDTFASYVLENQIYVVGGWNVSYKTNVYRFPTFISAYTTNFTYSTNVVIATNYPFTTNIGTNVDVVTNYNYNATNNYCWRISADSNKAYVSFNGTDQIEVTTTGAQFYVPIVMTPTNAPTPVMGGMYFDTNGVFYECTNGTTWTISATVGLPGTNGMDGTNGTNGTNGSNGTNGTNGTNGANGINGTTVDIYTMTQQVTWVKITYDTNTVVGTNLLLTCTNANPLVATAGGIIYTQYDFGEHPAWQNTNGYHVWPLTGWNYWITTNSIAPPSWSNSSTNPIGQYPAVQDSTGTIEVAYSYIYGVSTNPVLWKFGYSNNTFLITSNGVTIFNATNTPWTEKGYLTNDAFMAGYNLYGLSVGGTTTITRAMGQSVYLTLTNAQTFIADTSFPTNGDSVFSLSLNGNFAVTFPSTILSNTLAAFTIPSFTNAWGTVIFHKGFGQNIFIGR